jgi:hypothetical protein
MFVKYPHLERFGTDEVDGINLGQCHIFPKIDGTNASAWMEGSWLAAGSRTRVLTVEEDNAGFCAWLLKDPAAEPYRQLLVEEPTLRLYGEWLVPHSLKTYREDAWRKFYVFDVLDESGEFLHYDEYWPICQKYGVEAIPCGLKARNPTYEILLDAAQKNRYLLQENAGAGEGVVIKQYGWRNRFFRTTWAKLVLNAFKDKHIAAMGGAVRDVPMVEEKIVEEFITPHMIEKIIAKIRLSKDEAAFGARDIPRLLGETFHDLVTEELWEAIKKHRNLKIDFRALNHLAIGRVKHLKPELFGIAT